MMHHIVGPRTAGEAIAEAIRSQIATGRLRPGEMLPPERALLAEYGVARPTMRSALRILESDGLISIERGTKGGARVTVPDVAPLARRVGLHLQLRGTDVRDLIQAEAVLQPGVAGLAAVARDADDLARLRTAVDDLSGAVSIADYLTALTEFTDALLHAAHNSALSLFAELTSALLRTGLDTFVDTLTMSADETDDARAWATDQCRALVDLVERGDAAGAEAHWLAFLRRSGVAPTEGATPLEVYGGSAR
jgi:GntR family transcriptional regulator, transcriptional repressor for pyruvate dehydrogenase complex